MYGKFMYALYVGGTDYNSKSYSVTFPAGMTSVLFDIQIIDDSIVESNETFILNIINSSLPSGITASNPSQATVIIRNDDECKYISGLSQININVSMILFSCYSKL